MWQETLWTQAEGHEGKMTVGIASCDPYNYSLSCLLSQAVITIIVTINARLQRQAAARSDSMVPVECPDAASIMISWGLCELQSGRLAILAPKARLPLRSDIQLATLRKCGNICSASVCLLSTTRLALARLSVTAHADIVQQSMS